MNYLLYLQMIDDINQYVKLADISITFQIIVENWLHIRMNIDTAAYHVEFSIRKQIV